MKRASKLKEANLDLLNEEVLGMADDADKLQEFVTLAKTPEGQTLIKLMSKDYLTKARQLQGMYREANRDQLVAVIASMEAVWDMASLLVNAEKNLKYLDEALEEALSE